MMSACTRWWVVAIHLAAGVAACSDDDGNGNHHGNGDATIVDVGAVFPAGTALRDAYSGSSLTVAADGTVELTIPDRGVALLERDQAPGAEAEFSWDNAVVYFLITDRFFNGDPSNDNSYGRAKDGGDEIGTFHGGDLKGITAKLDYLADLGVNAIWISPIVEQIAGWVGGGNGDFRHYPYAGYWAKDWTKLDENWGTEADLTEMVDAAHARGIRVIVDVVMNHPGYASMEEIAQFVPSVLSPGWDTWEPGPGQSYHSFHGLFVDYTSPDWAEWWGPDWVRAELPGYSDPVPGDPLRESLASLPDFLTDLISPVDLPPNLQAKSDTNAVFLADTTIRGYLVSWLTRWVRDFGIDGFRADTAKHVELESWAALKTAGVAALADWKEANPTKALDDLPFWMTAEVFPHGVVKDAYFTEGGFDSVINFDFQRDAKDVVADSAELDALYREYADAINTDPTFNVLSYISSHDTELFFDQTGEDIDAQFAIGTALLLVPGGVQIYYGDETARRFGPTGSDRDAGTRSDMNWDSFDTDLLRHWQKLGQFRKRHIAIGAGSHQALPSESGYAFARQYSEGSIDDAVVVVFP